MSVEDPVEMVLVGVGEVIGPAQQGEAGSQAGPAHMSGAAAAARGVVSRVVPG